MNTSNSAPASGKCSELARKCINKGQEEETWALIDDTLNNVRARYPELYKTMMEELGVLAFKITPQEAENIVRQMRPKGQCWSFNQVQQILQQYGIDTKNPVDYYLAMNMYYNDSFDTARKFGHQNDVEFFLSLARDFVEDVDAKPYKVERYFLD